VGWVLADLFRWQAERFDSALGGPDEIRAISGCDLQYLGRVGVSTAYGDWEIKLALKGD